jgi:hypothetical protein
MRLRGLDPTAHRIGLEGQLHQVLDLSDHVGGVAGISEAREDAETRAPLPQGGTPQPLTGESREDTLGVVLRRTPSTNASASATAARSPARPGSRVRTSRTR